MRAPPLALFLLVVFPLAVLAQDTRGSLTGFVVDSAGSPIPSVLVTVRGPAVQGKRYTATGTDGSFLVPLLPVGEYEVAVARIGYREAVLTDVIVRLGRTTTLGAIVLSETPVTLAPLEARGQRSLIDPVSSAGGINLSPELYDNLPVSRDYLGMIDLLPQANTSYLGDERTMVGATGMENRYFVEGADVTDPMRGFYTIDLPYNFIREVEVKTGGYEAEYKSSLGGILNVVTYSGGNETRGRVFGFFANDQIAGSPRTAGMQLNRSDVTRWDIGATLEGPILHDRLWYFLAYNPLVASENVEIPGLDRYEDQEVRHRFAGKLTWRAGPRTSLYATVFGDPASIESVSAPGAFNSGLEPVTADSWLSERRDGSVTALANLTQALGSAGLLEASVYRLWREVSVLPRTPGGGDLQFRDFTTATMSGGLYATYVDRMYRTAARIGTTWELGKHAVKAGGEFTLNELDTDWELENVEKYAEDSWTYWELAAGGEATVKSRVPSLYLQDSWALSPRLRLNAGLRWESQYIVGSDGEVAQRILNEWQPRLGFVFQPGELGSQRIYGSYGRFYQDLPLMVAGLTYNDGLGWRITTFEHDPRLDSSGGTVIFYSGGIAEETEHLAGQHYDEFTLGYERQEGGSLKLGVRGVYRTLRRAVEDSWTDSAQALVLGNPGHGVLGEYPPAKREYLALALTAEKSFEGRLRLLGSYVLSRTYGNHGGVYDLDADQLGQPNRSFDYLEMLVNGEGLLPQDRTHQLKLAASYRTGYGFTLGGRFLWLTGTPLSEMGTCCRQPSRSFVSQRGTAGRTPSIWQLDLRLSCDLGHL
ncbi:MAG: TonB-dependent receptor, partial [Gemmatimonadota bacterium]